MGSSIMFAALLVTVCSITACGGGSETWNEDLAVVDGGSDAGASEGSSASDDQAADAGTGTDTGADTDNTATDSGQQAVSTAGIWCDYSQSVTNSQPSLNYTSEVSWTCDATQRRLVANGIPDHDVGTFPNANNPSAISEQSVGAVFTLDPEETGVSQTLGGPRGPAGYVINGVKIDANTAGTCDDSGSNCSMNNPMGGDWSIEALGQTSFDFGTDQNNAHVQPDGAYHYHGMPEGVVNRLLAEAGGEAMILIGWAADGFPIYARFGYTDPLDAASPLKTMVGSYQLVGDAPDNRPSVNLYPLGTFVQDWVYTEGAGDLDACNGRFGVTPEFPEGIYHYYATDTYPYLQRCVTGAL